MNTQLLELERLELLIETDHIPTHLKAIIEICIMAINDWPTPIESLPEYEVEVEKFINAKTTQNSIQAALAKIDVTKHAGKPSLYLN